MESQDTHTTDSIQDSQEPSTEGRALRLSRGPLLGLLVLLVVAGVYLLSFLGDSEEYLIPGVPYEGSYKGTSINTSGQFTAYTLLRFWGDPRFTPNDVVEMLPEGSGSNYASIADFLSSVGYDVDIVTVSGDVINEIIPYIDKNIPVAISQKMSSEIDITALTSRILIGYSKKMKEIVTHDNSFGNNYIISFDSFKELNRGIKPALLVVQPTQALLDGIIEGPDFSRPYPERLSIMDSESIRRIQILWGSVSGASSEPAIIVANIWEKIILEEDFDKLHPAARMLASYNLAQVYTNRLERHQDAIDVLEEITIPLLGIDFSKPFGEWERRNPEIYDSPFWKTKPWVMLGIAHTRLGNSANAQEAFERTLSENPYDMEAMSWLVGLDPDSSLLVLKQNVLDDDEESFVRKLIQESPWEGIWSTTGALGSLNLTLLLTGDTLVGKVLGKTGELGLENGAPETFGSDIDNIVVVDDSIYFKSKKGSWFYQFSMTQEGELSGRAYGKENVNRPIVHRIELTSTK